MDSEVLDPEPHCFVALCCCDREKLEGFQDQNNLFLFLVFFCSYGGVSVAVRNEPTSTGR